MLFRGMHSQDSSANASTHAAQDTHASSKPVNAQTKQAESLTHKTIPTHGDQRTRMPSPRPPSPTSHSTLYPDGWPLDESVMEYIASRKKYVPHLNFDSLWLLICFHSSSETVRPITLPATPDCNIVLPLEILNYDLEHWGFTYDSAAFHDILRAEQEISRTSSTEDARWREAREAWLVRGQDILVRIQQYAIQDMFHSFHPVPYIDIWSRISRAAHQIMYMMAATEVYLDLPTSS